MDGRINQSTGHRFWKLVTLGAGILSSSVLQASQTSTPIWQKIGMTEREYNTVMFSQVEGAQRANSKEFGYMLLQSWLAPIRDTIDPEENLIQKGGDKAEQRPDLAQVVQDKAAAIDKSEQ